MAASYERRVPDYAGHNNRLQTTVTDEVDEIDEIVEPQVATLAG